MLAKSQISILPPTALQIPADVGLKANPDLKKKRLVESLEEGEVGPLQGGKQQKNDPRATGQKGSIRGKPRRDGAG